MPKIEYNIKLNPDGGRPYIDLPSNYEDSADNKFFSLELTAYIMREVYEKRKLSTLIDQNTKDKMLSAILVLEQINDEVAKIIYGQMVNNGNVYSSFHDYSLKVETYDELLALPRINHVHDMIFHVEEGLMVYVTSEDIIYKFINDEWEGGVKDE